MDNISLYQAVNQQIGPSWGSDVPWQNHTGVCFSDRCAYAASPDGPVIGFTLGTPPGGAVKSSTLGAGLSACSCPLRIWSIFWGDLPPGMQLRLCLPHGCRGRGGGSARVPGQCSFEDQESQAKRCLHSGAGPCPQAPRALGGHCIWRTCPCCSPCPSPRASVQPGHRGRRDAL